MAVSKFCNVKLIPTSEVFALVKTFEEDRFEKKVNVAMGAYRDDEGKPWVLPVVKKIEQLLACDEKQNHEYLPILGFESFTKVVTALLLGSNSASILERRAFGVQGLSGTGSLRIGAEFLSTVLKYNTVYLSVPTWENHARLFANSGFLETRPYRYWDEDSRQVDIDRLLEDLKEAPKKSVVLLHACAHNPTGLDPTKEQWIHCGECGTPCGADFFSQPTCADPLHVTPDWLEKSASHAVPHSSQDVVKENDLFPFFDSAYQGFASGDLEEDAWAVRYFVEQGFEIFCAQSFAKNFGIYNERCGNLTVVLSDETHVKQVRSHFTHIVRGMYSTPPNHGARIVYTVLSNPELFEEWKECICTMSTRIKDMRSGLQERLEELGTPGKWDHITKQIGMFSYSGLNQIQVKNLISKYHIYLLENGRISMCGLSSKNLDYVANAICETVKL